MARTTAIRARSAFAQRFFFPPPRPLLSFQARRRHAAVLPRHATAVRHQRAQMPKRPRYARRARVQRRYAGSASAVGVKQDLFFWNVRTTLPRRSPPARKRPRAALHPQRQPAATVSMPPGRAGGAFLPRFHASGAASSRKHLRHAFSQPPVFTPRGAAIPPDILHVATSAVAAASVHASAAPSPCASDAAF